MVIVFSLCRHLRELIVFIPSPYSAPHYNHANLHYFFMKFKLFFVKESYIILFSIVLLFQKDYF